jgi:hypothetical protein
LAVLGCAFTASYCLSSTVCFSFIKEPAAENDFAGDPGASPDFRTIVKYVSAAYTKKWDEGRAGAVNRFCSLGERELREERKE